MITVGKFVTSNIISTKVVRPLTGDNVYVTGIACMLDMKEYAEGQNRPCRINPVVRHLIILS